MSSRQVCVLDYGLGNVRSVVAALQHVGGKAFVSSDAEVILKSSHLVIPGVGAFGQGMEHIKARGLVETVNKFLAFGRPILGICLGMQIALDEGEEFGHHKGLGIVPGVVRKLPRSRPDVKLPNIGWRAIRINIKCVSPIAKCLRAAGEETQRFYFVHSFVPIPADPLDAAATSDYEGTEFTCAVARGNYLGVQFHPEKSGEAGLALLDRFLDS
jgi:glutamine amidotransferase